MQHKKYMYGIKGLETTAQHNNKLPLKKYE
jgi:hypothetical protein